MICYNYNNKTLNEVEVIETMEALLNEAINDSDHEIHKLAQVLYKLPTIVDSIDELRKKGQKAKDQAKNNPGKYISVTNFSTAVHVVQGREVGRMTAEVKPDERKAAFIRDHKNDPQFAGDESAVIRSYDEQIALEEEYKKVGVHIHSLVNILLTKGKNSVEWKDKISELEMALTENDSALAKALTNEDPLLKPENTGQIVKLFVQRAEDIVTWVNKKWPEAKRLAIFSEMPMVLENAPGVHLSCKNEKTGLVEDYDGLLGIADLIVVDENNKVHLVDFKISSRPYAEWLGAKHNEVELQLAAYRGMLTDIGISGDDITLTVKPTLMPKGKMSMITDEPEVDLLASTGGISRVAWRGGGFTADLRKFGIGNQPVLMTVNDDELHQQIDEDWEKIMGFRKDPKLVTKQEIIDKGLIIEDKDDKGKVIGYKFWSNLDGMHGGYIRRKTQEEFTKEGGVLDQYIEELASSRKVITKTLMAEIQAIKETRGSKVSDFLKNEKNAKRARNLRSRLGKYLGEDWKFLSPQFPQLADYGILLFGKSDGVSGNMILEIVSIAEFPLQDRVPINGEQTVLGKYYTDAEAFKLKIPVMTSHYRNVKAIEAISVVNTLLNKYPDSFKSHTIGNLVILNPFGESDDNKGINLEDAKQNFALLCAKENADIPNSFDKIPTPTTYEYCMSELSAVLQQIDVDSDLHQLLTDIDNGTETLVQKRARVEELLQKMRNRYKELQNSEFGKHGKWNLDNPVQLCYMILIQMNNYLHGIKIDFDGKVAKYGLNLSNLFAMLGLPFTGRLPITDSSGHKISGFAGGTEITSPRTTPSNTLRQLNAYYDLMYNNVRREFAAQTGYVSNLTKNYIKNFSGEAASWVSSEHSKIWERLIQHDGDKLNPQMMFKNPYDDSNDLTAIDREFLKAYLWELNKYRLKSSAIQTDWTYEKNKEEIESLDVVATSIHNNDSEYFQMPLARAETFQRLTHLADYGLGNYFKAKWEDFRETYDPRSLHSERRAQIKKNDITEMYNAYSVSQFERNKIIESVTSPYDFSLDLDFLALDVAFNSIRKKHFDSALILTETVTAMMEFQQQETGANFSNEIEAAQTQAKISITNESTLSEEQEDIAKPLGIVRQLNSFILLACRPLSFLKELTFGMFTNFSRAWALKYGSNKLSIKSVGQANAIIWGQKFGKYGKAFTGEGSLADFTMCEALNRYYGIANWDLNRTVKNSALSRMGKFDNMSKWMYIAQSAPDYYNRMTLFIAKMIEDGCFEAHTLDKYGVISYDWKKDKRFDKLAQYGLNSSHSDPEYNKQKALYAAMCQEFEKGGEQLITWDRNQKKYIYGDITQAYTSDQRASIKEVSDMAYGFYDHESKSQLNHKFLGLVFLQFQTFLSAKYNLWFKAPAKNRGNTAQGKFVQVERNGVKYYDKFITDDQGNLIRVDKVPETELTDSEKLELQPSMEWEGDFIEGLFFSIGYTIHDIFTLNWKEIVNNKQRLANVGLAMHDLLLGIVLVSILKAIFSQGTNKLTDIKPTQRVLVRALEDIGPGAFTKVSITPSFITTLNTLKSDGIKLLFHDSQEAIDTMTKHFGFTRDFYWSEN